MAIYYINKHRLFSSSDISPAVNGTISEMKSGDSAILDFGEYEFSETIEIGSQENHMKYCTVILKGIYKFNGRGPAMRVRADFFNLEIDKFYTGFISDHYPETELPGGIEVLESNYSTIKIDELEGFQYGLKLCPDTDNTGICYTKFNFRFISYCYIPLYFSVNDNAVGWVNENQFFGGRLKGYYGLKAEKGRRQIDECNNNTFYNIAFESIETDGVNLEFCTFNTFISPRFEAVMRYAINESEDCKSNKYIISVALPLDSINIHSKYTEINAPLHTYWQHMIRKYMTDAEGNKSYEFFRDVTVTLDDGTSQLPMNCKNIVIPQNVSNVKIMLDRYSEFENNIISILNNSDECEITVIQGNREIIVESMPLETGKYELLYTRKSWNLIGNTSVNKFRNLNSVV